MLYDGNGLGTNLKSCFFKYMFPESEANLSKMHKHRSFQNNKAFRIDSESLPDRFPAVFY